jgi:hypothetical protein
VRFTLALLTSFVCPAMSGLVIPRLFIHLQWDLRALYHLSRRHLTRTRSCSTYSSAVCAGSPSTRASPCWSACPRSFDDAKAAGQHQSASTNSLSKCKGDSTYSSHATRPYLPVLLLWRPAGSPPPSIAPPWLEHRPAAEQEQWTLVTSKKRFDRPVSLGAQQDVTGTYSSESASQLTRRLSSAASLWFTPSSAPRSRALRASSSDIRVSSSDS